MKQVLEGPLLADGVEKRLTVKYAYCMFYGVIKMMGHLPGGQEHQFYAFNLESVVPEKHLLRSIDRCLNLADLRDHLAEYYSHTGRPSIDPELMIRMLVVGYCYGIRSERRLCEEVHLNLAYRWFCRLSLEDVVPNHSTFSKNRHGRFRESGTFRWVFDKVVRACMAAGLVKGEGFAVDASIIEAEAGSKLAMPGDEPHVWQNPAHCKRAVREYLEGLDNEAPGMTIPKRISLADPQSSWTAAPGGPAFFAYSTNYLIDVAHGVIMDVEATPAHRTAEVDSTKLMVDRVEANFNITPQRLIGDTAYGTAPMLAWMVDEKAIEPHIPVWDRTERKDGTFSRSDFHWDREANQYRCPADKALRCDRRSFKTPQYQQSRCERKKVEMLFAHLKRILKLGRLRLRGLSGASDEFTLAATVQNLRRLAKMTSPLLLGGIVAPAECKIG